VRVLFYSDVVSFGGHEVQTVLAAQQLSQQLDAKVGFLLNPANERLVERLGNSEESQSGPDLIFHGYRSRSFQGVRTLFECRSRSKIEAAMRAYNPDVILVSQGTIEISSRGLIAAMGLGVPVVSYIPFAHSLASMQVKLGTFRDMMNRIYYRSPTAFITSSMMAAKCIGRWGVPDSRIHVVENGIAVDRIRYLGNRARRHETFTFGVVGRLDFRQKGHDLLLRALALHAPKLRGMKILVIGDGPDRESLDRLIEELRLREVVTVQPWETDVNVAFEKIDGLLLPSRYEGVPVVMQEAMAAGLPIAGSAIPGIAEYLPKPWLFDREDATDLVETLLRVSRMENADALKRNREFVLHECAQVRVGEKFRDILLGISNSGVKGSGAK
jgi:hypothetical protein